MNYELARSIVTVELDNYLAGRICQDPERLQKAMDIILAAAAVGTVTQKFAGKIGEHFLNKKR